MAKKAQAVAPAPAQEKEAEKPAIAKTTVNKGASAERLKIAEDEKQKEMEDRADRLISLMNEKVAIDEQIKAEKVHIIGYAVARNHLFAGKKSFCIGQAKVSVKNDTEYVASVSFDPKAFYKAHPTAVVFEFVNAEVEKIPYESLGLKKETTSKIEVGRK